MADDGSNLEQIQSLSISADLSLTAFESLELRQCQVSASSVLDQGPVFVVQSSPEDVGICTESKVSGDFYWGKWLAWGVPRLLKIQKKDCKTRPREWGRQNEVREWNMM